MTATTTTRFWPRPRASSTAYFDRRLREFDLPLEPGGTAFQERVWEQLQKIAYGETATYGEIAGRLGMSPGASRAVGAANGRNPIGIVIPCHRVVGSAGSLSGYAGGVERKQLLLRLEQEATLLAGRASRRYSAARRSDSERRSAAASTAGACMRPGWRESRSSGPDTETAAMILPEGERIGADTEATPCSRSPTDWAQPRRRMPARAVAENAAFCRPRCMRSGSSQASRIWAAEPGAHRQLRPDRDRVAQAGGTLGGGDADAVVTLPAPHLCGLAGDVTQPREHRAGRGEQPVLAGGRGELGEAGPEHEAALHVAGHETVVLQRHGEPVGGRAGEPRAGHETRQGGRSGLERRENEGGFVEHADSARVVHTLIMPSHIMDCKSSGGASRGPT